VYALSPTLLLPARHAALLHGLLQQNHVLQPAALKVMVMP
jgi:hypothetical protein